MRRDSQLAAVISARVGVSRRRVESWGNDKLGVSAHLPLDKQVAHYEMLVEVSGPGRGRSADVAARRMAAHGFLCPRLRAALLRGMNIAEVGGNQDLLDFSTDDASDESFVRLEAIVLAMIAAAPMMPPPLRQMMSRLQRNAETCASKLGEPAEHLLHSGIANFMSLLLGGELYNAKAMAAILAGDASAIRDADLEFVNQQMRITIPAVDEAYRSAPLPQIVAMAVWLRQHAEEAAPFLCLERASDAQLDDLAALFAPFAFHVVQVGSCIESAQGFIESLELPPGVTPAPDSPAASA